MKNKKTYTENYDLCLSDIFSGVLFVFILILIYFILQFQEKKNDLTKPLVERGKLLEELKTEIEKRGVSVTIEKNEGVLRLSDLNNCTYFQSTEYYLTSCGRNNFNKIKAVFFKILPCYADKESFERQCKNKKIKERNVFGLLDSVLIEGHTDVEPIGPSFRKSIKNNLDLSSKRARETYSFLLEYKEVRRGSPKGNLLFDLYSSKTIGKNKDIEKIFGIAGYGSTRPTWKNNKFALNKENKDNDRRIDIRFIMKIPDNISQEVRREVKKIK